MAPPSTASRKKITGYIKLQINAGKAVPAPPVGPALGQRGLNIMEFCKAFNARTADQPADAKIPVVITVYADKTFDFITKLPPVSYWLRKAAGVKSGSQAPGKGSFVGKITMEQLREIAEKKIVDMNAYDVEQAISMLKGSARSMGLEVVSA